MSLHRIQLRFHEAECERTQESTIRWSPAAGEPANEIVRQQWNFSRTASTTEIEDYAVDLNAVSVLELAIEPDQAIAKQLRPSPLGICANLIAAMRLTRKLM